MSEAEAWQVTDDAAVLYEKSFVPAIFAQSAVFLADAVGALRADRALDVACGTGAVARELARRVGPEGRVVGLDLNPRMLEVAKRVAPEIEWRHGDAEELPVEDGSFDVVTSQYALMFFPDRARALREMWRVLAPGGRLGVATCGPIGAAPGYDALAKVAEEVCSPEIVEMLHSPFALGDEAELRELVGAAGIEGARVESRPCPVRFPSIDALVHAEVRASPIRDVIDERRFAALLEGARNALQSVCDGDGTVAFSMAPYVVVARKS